MSEIRWIKLSVDMFDNKKIKYLRHLPDGNTIVLIWVMLLTMAGRCNAGGMIFLTENIPYTPKTLSDELGFEENTVLLALGALNDLGMISSFNNNLFVDGWSEHQNTEGMDKIREQNRERQRRFKENQKRLAEGNVTDNVTSRDGNATDIDIDIDKEYINNMSDNSDIPYAQIIEYLNEKCGTHYRTSTQKTRKLIKARYNEGFDESDFFTVIDKMVSKWKNDSTMNRYLRPETLFSPKFESYLNEPVNHDEALSAELDAWSEGAEVFCGPF